MQFSIKTLTPVLLLALSSLAKADWNVDLWNCATGLGGSCGEVSCDSDGDSNFGAYALSKDKCKDAVQIFDGQPGDAEMTGQYPCDLTQKIVYKQKQGGGLNYDVWFADDFVMAVKLGDCTAGDNKMQTCNFAQTSCLLSNALKCTSDVCK